MHGRSDNATACCRGFNAGGLGVVRAIWVKSGGVFCQHDLQLALGVGSRALLRDHEQSPAVSATHHWQGDEPRVEKRLCLPARRRLNVRLVYRSVSID